MCAAKSVQAPIGGINSYDSLDDMSEDEAVFLDNWVPGTGACRMRGGSAVYSDTGGSNVGMLVEYAYSDGDLFICAVDDKILDITSPTVPVELGSGFATPRWQNVVFNEKLILVNGVDLPQQYDGTTFAAIDFTGSPPELIPTALVGVNVYQGRAYYWENQSTIYWHGAAGGYAGELFPVDLSFIAKRGGTIKTIFTWSTDAGDGLNDFLVFLMTSGEAIIYVGTDPAALASWNLVGKYKMGEPINVRGNVSIAGDEIILTRSGWQSMEVIIRSGEGSDPGITRNAAGISIRAVEQYYQNQNWDAVFYPAGPYIIINVPEVDGFSSVQHIMTTNRGKWATFSGWNANTFGVFDQSLYYGDNSGIVYICDDGVSDNGNEVVTDALPAYNYLSGRANSKQLTGIRVITTSSEPGNIALATTSDYLIPNKPQTNPSGVFPSSTPWGSPWGSAWETDGAQEAKGVWQSKNAFGYSLSYRMATSSNYETQVWLSSQIMFKEGGLL